MTKSTYSAKIIEVNTIVPNLPTALIKFAEKKVSLEQQSYAIEVKNGDRTWIIDRKFKEIKSFYSQLNRFGFQVDYFPAKFVLKPDETILAQRKEALNRFLEEVVKNPVVTDSNTWKLFIGETIPQVATPPPSNPSYSSSSSSNSYASNNNNTSFHQAPPPQPQPQPQPQQQSYATSNNAQPNVINLGNLLDMAKQMQQAMHQPGFVQPVQVEPQPSQPPPPLGPQYQQPGVSYQSAPAQTSSHGMHATTSSGQSNALITDIMDLSQLPPDFWNVYTKARIPTGSLGPFQSFSRKYVPIFILLDETIDAQISYRVPVKVFGLTGFSTQEHRNFSLYNHDSSEETWMELFHCKPLMGGIPTYVAIGNARLPTQLANRVYQLQQVHSELQKAQQDWTGEFYDG